MNSVIVGAVAMASAVAALFFLRFWRQTRDRLFLFFSLAFAADAVTSVLLVSVEITGHDEPLFYLARLITFLLILGAIVHKNRPRS